MQAIRTKYLSPTNTRGARIKATCEAGSLTVPYRYDLDTSDMHRKAAFELMEKLGWNPKVLHTGELPEVIECYAHVMEF